MLTEQQKKTIEQYYTYAIKCVAFKSRGGQDQEWIRDQAIDALIKAASTYEEGKGSCFKTYLSNGANMLAQARYRAFRREQQKTEILESDEDHDSGYGYQNEARIRDRELSGNSDFERTLVFTPDVHRLLKLSIEKIRKSGDEKGYKKKNIERYIDIVILRALGLKLYEIGERYNLSRERVRRIELEILEMTKD